MRILNLLKRLLLKEVTPPKPPAADSAVREIQQKLMSAARENGMPRIGG